MVIYLYTYIYTHTYTYIYIYRYIYIYVFTFTDGANNICKEKIHVCHRLPGGGTTKAWDPELLEALRPQTAPELQGVMCCFFFGGNVDRC